MAQKPTGNGFDRIHLDFDQLPYLTNPWRQLNLKGVALGFIRLPAGEGYTFTHTHVAQEEVYIVIEGQGEILINNRSILLEKGDVVRVDPASRRALKAADDTALFAICAGGVAAGYPQDSNARYLIDDGIPDYDDIPPWYQGNAEVAERNACLKERMLKAKARRMNPQE